MINYTVVNLENYAHPLRLLVRNIRNMGGIYTEFNERRIILRNSYIRSNETNCNTYGI